MVKHQLFNFFFLFLYFFFRISLLSPPYPYAGLLRPALHQPGGASHASHSVPPCAGFCAPPCAGPEAPPHIPWVNRTTATCWAHGTTSNSNHHDSRSFLNVTILALSVWLESWLELLEKLQQIKRSLSLDLIYFTLSRMSLTRTCTNCSNYVINIAHSLSAWPPQAA